jgi:hypothetical protein
MIRSARAICARAACEIKRRRIAPRIVFRRTRGESGRDGHT